MYRDTEAETYRKCGSAGSDGDGVLLLFALLYSFFVLLLLLHFAFGELASVPAVHNGGRGRGSLH